ncbi:DUF761 domain protein [Quillaja saponaria]|uniref:DUF761 domain protein n=1 Tax=Quillaja saponaria TaxID=32244 RepID=A0AAD7VE94_QUISA|nr:DUF761 domain protein [Quillaja saponaria]
MPCLRQRNEEIVYTLLLHQLPRPLKFLDQPLRRKKKFTRRASHTPICKFHRNQGAVYIDKLFKEPVPKLVEHLRPKLAKSSTTAKSVKHLDQPVEVPEAIKRCEAEKPCTSDDMRESLPLASPLLRGIDKRAEEFITRFRGEMLVQEMLAGNL